jgi:DNA-binding winged helix-turn-helix (wHTH) protein
MAPDAMPTLETGMEVEAGRIPAPRYIRFGPFQIDQQREEVTHNGSRLKLQGKVYQVLLALLEKPGEVVTREELRQRLWPDALVNYDANVNTTVNKLRQMLGDSPDKPIYVETIPRKGYCFVGRPEFSDQAAASQPGAASATNPSSEADQARAGQRQAFPFGSRLADSSFWVTLGVLGLVLAGMLLGAGIATLWNTHLAPLNPWP